LRDLREESPLHGSIYRRGIFDDRSDPWEVFVAEIGPGNEATAAEAVRVIDHYDPQVALFVGIAGAIKDVKHGDVVASTKIYNYEAGKDTTGGFQTRPDTELPAYDLLSRARHEAGELDWRNRIRVAGPEVAAPPDAPEAKVGPVAAGPKVLASTRTATYKFIREHYGDAIAVELEGHGFLLGVRMNHQVQGIVVRGVSDRIGDKTSKNDEYWQPIAARHAAAFAFQILAKLSGSEGLAQGSPAVQLDESWQQKHLQDIAATAGPRYSPELQLGTPLHDAFEALCGTDSWIASVRLRYRKARKPIMQWLESVGTKDKRTWGTPFPEHLETDGLAVGQALQAVDRALLGIVERRKGASPTAVAAAVSAVQPQVHEINGALRQDLESRHGEGTADSASFRQFQAEYQMSFPASNVDAARDLLKLLEELETWSRSSAGRAAGAQGILLVGAAGTGKTHAISDIAYDRWRRGRYTVVLFGEQFASADEPWERIRQLLGFGPIARDDLLAAMDAAGNAFGGCLLLCIDGLNETRPRGYWRHWLPSLVTQIARYEHIKLCVSCRTTYEPMVFPERHGLERVEHVGFAGWKTRLAAISSCTTGWSRQLLRVFTPSSRIRSS
jgi:nucleoside phosphorylase